MPALIDKLPLMVKLAVSHHGVDPTHDPDRPDCILFPGLGAYCHMYCHMYCLDTDIILRLRALIEPWFGLV